MGENDAYLETLQDKTIVKKQGELRRCLYCEKIRLGNAAVCLYCQQKQRTRTGIIFVLVLFIVSICFLAAFLIPLRSEIPPPRYPLPSGLEENLGRLRHSDLPVPIISWYDAFLEDSCSLCPDCCSSVVPDALGPIDIDPAAADAD
jgi:hypothetical protein